MSREFGSYSAGYFHYQMETAAEDCKSGNDELTRLWGEFFEEFKHIAYAIASSEAGDSGADFPIYETMRNLPSIKDKIAKIEEYIQPFEAVAKRAIRDKIEK